MHNNTTLPIIVLVTSSLQLLASGSTDWRTGDQFQQQLKTSVAFTAKNALRPSVSKLSRKYQVLIFLDRRIDPDQRLDLTVQYGPMDQALRTLAGSLNLGISYLAPVIYIGPPEVTARLATVAANRRNDIGQLPPELRSRWQRVRSWQWPRFTTPRELLDRLANETHCKIVNADSVPHDLWPAVELPEMSATDRLALVLAGFSLTFELTPDGTSLRLVDMPEKVTEDRLYLRRGKLSHAVSQISARFPRVAIERQGRHLKVTGTHEDHVAIRRWVRGETMRPKPAAAPEKVFSLDIKREPAGAVVKAVVEQLRLTVKLSPEVAERLNQPISMRVKDVRLDELLHKTLDPIGVRFRIDGQTLELTSD